MTKDQLNNLYVKQKLSSSQIAEQICKSEWWVLNKLKEHKIPKRGRGNQGLHFVDLTSQKFGNYTVISRGTPNEHGRIRWVCRCDCGNVKEVDASSLQKGSLRHCEKCAPNPCWKGHGEISGAYFSNLENGAKRRGIKFNVKIEDAWKIYQEQNGKCALSGLDIFFARNFSNSKGGQTASLDRVDSKGVYELGNVRWLHKNVNVMRWNMTDEYFLEICKKIVKHTNKHTNKHE